MLRYPFLAVALAALLVANSSYAGHHAGGMADDDLLELQHEHEHEEAVQKEAVQKGSVQKGAPQHVQKQAPHTVQKTVYTPQWVTETRKVMVTRYVHEEREGVKTVMRCVPEQREVQRSCTVMVPERRTKTVPVTQYRPVHRQVEQQYAVRVPEWTQREVQYTVMVSHVEARQGVRQVTQWVEEEVVKTVHRDHGHWEVQMVQVPCYSKRLCRRRACCDPCCGTRTVCQKVWVPNIVEEEVTVTVCRPQIVEEPYEYHVTVCKPEVRTKMVNVCNMRTEMRTRMCTVVEYERVVTHREVCYTVLVPQTRTWTEMVTTYRQVAEQVPYTYTVCVPVQEEQEIEVQVCQMVATTIDVPVCTVTCYRPAFRRLRCL